jgi:hypothetical protein
MVRRESVINRLPEPGVKVFMARFAQQHRQPRNVILPANVMFVHLSATSAKYASRQTRRDHDGLARVRYKRSYGDSFSAKALRIRWTSFLLVGRRTPPITLLRGNLSIWEKSPRPAAFSDFIHRPTKRRSLAFLVGTGMS